MKGFIRIRTILLAILVILILSFFSFDIQSFIEAPQTQSNLSYVWGGVVSVWDQYLSVPLTYLWQDIFLDLLWSSFVTNLQSIQSGQGPSFIQSVPQTPNFDLSPYPTN